MLRMSSCAAHWTENATDASGVLCEGGDAVFASSIACSSSQMVSCAVTVMKPLLFRAAIPGAIYRQQGFAGKQRLVYLRVYGFEPVKNAVVGKSPTPAPERGPCVRGHAPSPGYGSEAQAHVIPSEASAASVVEGSPARRRLVRAAARPRCVSARGGAGESRPRGRRWRGRRCRWP